jgi:hypothetical protein
MDEPKNVPANSDGPPPKQGKPVWEIVLTTTPIVLAVVATFLAGQSSSEMTRAQYHRSLASQNQSKAGDQWAFFQAKRNRGSNAQLSARWIALVKDPQKVDVQTLPDTARQLAEDLRRAHTEDQELLQQIAQASPELGKDEADQLQARAETLLATTDKAAAEAARAGQEIDRTFDLHKARLTTVFAYLNPRPPEGKPDKFWGLPRIEEVPITDSKIQTALQAVRERKTDADIAKRVLGLNEPQLTEAIAGAEANAKAFDDATVPVDETLRELDKWVSQEVELARACSRAAARVQGALAGTAVADNPKLAPLRQAARRVERRSEAAKAMADQLQVDFEAAELAYTTRRYEREARYNQEAAFLYDVQKHRSSADSDRHLMRSKLFFYGMLAAQVGVTISTLALAVRQKSILWGLAAIAGLVAVMVGGYLLLDLG